MPEIVQVTYIVWNLLLTALCFAAIGKTAEGTKYAATAQGAFTHGLFTIAFVIWWDTPDMLSLYAKIAMFALLWLPWVYDLADIHQPWKPVTLREVAIGTLITAARIGLVLGFWVLY